MLASVTDRYPAFYFKERFELKTVEENRHSTAAAFTPKLQLFYKELSALNRSYE